MMPRKKHAVKKPNNRYTMQKALTDICQRFRLRYIRPSYPGLDNSWSTKLR